MRNVVSVSMLLVLMACSSDEGPGPVSTTTTSPATRGTNTSTSTTAAPGTLTVLAVGDIGTCAGTDDEAVAALVATLEGEVLLLGDIAYPDGTAEQFKQCFEPAWGRFRARLRPVPGNHDFHTRGGAGYFGWFGAAAGEQGKGWHSFDVGAWHVVALNSNCSSVGGCGPESEQGRWLRADLARSRARCTLAFWHHARFSSGSMHGSDPVMDDAWRVLASAGADLVLVGHEHVYERLAPLNAFGRVDASGGIRSFVVGTGGRSHYGFGRAVEGSEVRHAGTFGLLELALSPEAYRWRFVPVAGGTFEDRGEDRCH
jgi:hypothetical protein